MESSTRMPPGAPHNVVILGSTGSIGRSALSVVAHDGGARLKAWGLSAHSRWGPLVEQARAFLLERVAREMGKVTRKSSESELGVSLPSEE